MKSIVLALLILSVIAMSLPQVTFAQESIPEARDTLLNRGPGGVISLVKTITNWLFTLLLALAVVFIILAAYKYLISGGGEEVGKAHKMLIYAAVAIAVAFLAKGIVFVVEELVTRGGAGGFSDRASRDSIEFRYQGRDVDGGIRIGL